jgi:FixJ family two-component response regulator
MRNDSSGLVYLIVRNRPLRERLARLLNACGLRAEAYDSIDTLLRFHRDMEPSCAVVEVGAPDSTAVDLHADLARRGVRLPVLYLVTARKLPTDTIELGGAEFLSKPVDSARFVEWIRAALAPIGKEPSATADWLSGLTAREREVLELITSGLSNKEIGRRLGISHRTVEVHRQHILSKSGARNALELASLLRGADLQTPGRHSQAHAEG